MSKKSKRVENLTIPSGRCGTQRRTREIERENAERRKGPSATKSVIPHSRYDLVACKTRQRPSCIRVPSKAGWRARCTSVYIDTRETNKVSRYWPFSSATPPTFAGTRPTCHFFANSESSLDTYKIIAARCPFCNSQRIRGNAERILIFLGKYWRTETEWLYENPLETFQSALWLFVAYIFPLVRYFASEFLDTFNGSLSLSLSPWIYIFFPFDNDQENHGLLGKSTLPGILLSRQKNYHPRRVSVEDLYRGCLIVRFIKYYCLLLNRLIYLK